MKLSCSSGGRSLVRAGHWRLSPISFWRACSASPRCTRPIRRADGARSHPGGDCNLVFGHSNLGVPQEAAMSDDDDDDDNARDRHYKRELRKLQIELVKLQRHLLKKNARVLVILEGRDGAGKDGTIKRLIEHMSPRDTRVHAPNKPSDRERTQWYFQRFVRYLPSADEFVVFNRSWYNRAGVERVMGFADADQVESFLENVVRFEQMLVRDGIALRKYYLDI